MRQESTADSSTILVNMDRFLAKWKECEVNGWKMINQAAIKEIDLLKVHVSKGCLSNLPKSAGTNRNERLHGEVQKWL